MKPANTNRPCPVCGKASELKYQPFCSARCADVDLHRWLGGVYRVETNERPEDEGRRDEE
ncbi:MAG TPA: DNA gyrase inhibitor YacG [Candidatus Omnitrophota bacterium]|nr:DNA gyrase inhibitor YacG [Candidatus Omnitrophota bacterium]